jgi:hypothetical protein
VTLTEESAPLYHALGREAQWLDDAWRARWARGS